MCATCGCSAGGAVVQLISGGEPDHADAGRGHGHDHGHDLGHDRDHEASEAGRTVLLQHKVLAKNDDIAAGNRDWLRRRGVCLLNLMSSPGAGKTTLLERTARDLVGALAFAVIDPPAGSMVVIENVGNLVYPAMFDLGEAVRVVLASVPEGADKPVKYPHMFRQADLVLLSKADLLPYVNFDLNRYTIDLRRVNPAVRLMRLSAVTGEGLQEWYDWLHSRIP